MTRPHLRYDLYCGSRKLETVTGIHNAKRRRNFWEDKEGKAVMMIAETTDALMQRVLAQ